MKMNMGGSVAFAMAEEVKKAVADAGSDSTRFVVISIDAKAEKLNLNKVMPESASWESDFKALADVVEAGVPSFIVAFMSGHMSFGPKDVALLAWKPEDTPVKLRMLVASCQKGVKESLTEVEWCTTVQVSEKEDLTYKSFCEETKELSVSERRAAMTQQERDAEDVRAAQAKVQQAAPKKLAGMASIAIKEEGTSFRDAVKAMMDGDGKAVLGKLTGAKGEELSGSSLDGISSPADLKGKLPEEEPAYVLMKAHGGVLLISWLPENSKAGPRMKISTFKASVKSLSMELTGKDSILTAEVSLPEWLSADCGKPSAEDDAAGSPSGGEKKKGLPPGAVKMPGMPVGGFALPGMGK